jgi:hypothetical protein
MNLFMVVLRLIHIGAGVFWAGGAVVLARFVIPAVGDTGPEGGKVVQALQQRGLMTALPASAVVSILFGRTPTGMALGLGAVVSIAAFTIGMTIMRPSTMKARALAQTLQQLTDAANWIAGLLGLAVVTMAVARYL